MFYQFRSCLLLIEKVERYDSVDKGRLRQRQLQSGSYNDLRMPEIGVDVTGKKEENHRVKQKELKELKT